MLFPVLKDKKALMTIMKENLRFKEMRLNYLSKQQKTKAKKGQLRLVINSVRVGVVSTRTINFRPSSVFLTNLKHLSYTNILVLLL